jgi:hypothetical protein
MNIGDSGSGAANDFSLFAAQSTVRFTINPGAGSAAINSANGDNILGNLNFDVPLTLNHSTTTGLLSITDLSGAGSVIKTGIGAPASPPTNCSRWAPPAGPWIRPAPA